MGGSAGQGKDTFRRLVRRACLADETKSVHHLIRAMKLAPCARRRIEKTAAGMVEDMRRAAEPGLMEIFLAEYGLGTKEGVALMCLAEALLRVPDSATIDALIQDKIAPSDWGRHIGRSGSPLVNASTWALMLTGKVIAPEDAGNWDIVGILRAMIKRAGDPVIRNAVGQSMRILGHQFVLGRDIDEALKRAKSSEEKGYTHSYDMLGEAAHTAEDARRYFLSYSGAITALADQCIHDDIRRNPGISIKLSALHPRYEFTRRKRATPELSARAASLALLAKNANMGFNIDAEEADRLDMSLDIIANVLANPDLKGWDGFGIVVQSYMPRAIHVIDWAYDLARRLDRRIMVRLVKGAYWDSEIKQAQEQGLAGYPVFTRKLSTDIAYMACARRLLERSDRIYPQFATHNAHSAAAVLEMAGSFTGFEFQRLHGMGEALFTQIRERHDVPCRIYAPVGVHKDLLAYLVRRLLENGANSSFVNQVLDDAVPAGDLVRDPVGAIEALASIPNPRIPLPAAIFGPARQNSRGWNLADPLVLQQLAEQRGAFKDKKWTAAPLINGKWQGGKSSPVLNPANAGDRLGEVVETSPEQIETALKLARSACKGWRQTAPDYRAHLLRRIADLYDKNAAELMVLATREAGKTWQDGIAELREAVDFCRYYANEAEALFAAGGREGRGVFLCISPWNFPLAIFTGQITAALVSGNAVIAKPAQQTPLMAARAVELMHEAGIPADALQLLPGGGPLVGGVPAADPRIDGICFTGSTRTAQIINRTMATSGNAKAPLIAETGGVNAMIVDSSALPEQAVTDIISSAFQSAGQRCSALRIVFVQADIADSLIPLLKGAMDELVIGDPRELATDIGPVIDRLAKADIEAHCRAMEEKGRLIKKLPVPGGVAENGHFIAPAAYRLEGMDELKREIFGPVLHLVTFEAQDLGAVVESINASGYGLTLGVHTRVDSRVQTICDKAHIGNIYVNRNQIGAVVGSQPFGGEGLSGTGPKAGGPHYLRRFTRTGQGNRDQSAIFVPAKNKSRPALQKAVSEAFASREDWERLSDRRALIEAAGKACCVSTADAIGAILAAAPDIPVPILNLPGPTGESNRLSLHGRGVFLCLGAGGGGTRALVQAALALLLGNSAVVPAGDEAAAFARALHESTALSGPLAVAENISLHAIETAPHLAGVIFEGGGQMQRALRKALAAREGAILPLIDDLSEWPMLMIERALCIDTTASGGNAALLAAAGAPA